MWRSIAEVETILKDVSSPERLERFSALALFWEQAVFQGDYRSDDRWEEMLVPTDAGKSCMADLSEIRKRYPSADFYLALFGQFYYHDILFDWQRSNVEEIAALLENEMLAERVRFPDLFGRGLYERFNDAQHGSKTEHLDPADAARLLDGTANGVYQLGTLVTGPLGLLESEEARFVPPTLNLPLWHCSDTGCRWPHYVELRPWPTPLTQARRSIREALESSHGPPSEWSKPLAWLHRGAPPGRYRAYYDIVALLADCVVGSERTALLAAALRGPSAATVRQGLSKRPRTKESTAGSPEEIAERLAPGEQLQLLALMPDRLLVRLIDDSISEGAICVTLGEVRTPQQAPPPLSYRDSGSEISALGVRSSKGNPVVNLTSLIWRAYAERGAHGSLRFQLRAGPEDVLQESLVSFIRTQGPERAVRDLLLSNEDATNFLCEQLGLRILPTVLDDPRTVNVILWKLGAHVPQYDEVIPRFQQRLSRFKRAVLEASPLDSETLREGVREAGVNLFVSVEEFLDRLLAYNVWVLASDHFLGTEFRFDTSQARLAVGTVLGQELQSQDKTIVWSIDGENSLGVLLRYLAEAVRWMSALPEKDRASLLRPAQDLPHYSDDVRYSFPFVHSALWADSHSNGLRSYVEGFSRIVKLLDQGQLPLVRNGLDHWREPTRFPKSDAMLACEAYLTDAMRSASDARYFPRVFWLHRVTSDRFGQVMYELRDCKGEPLGLNGPPFVLALPDIEVGSPLLVAPGRLLEVPNAQILFTICEPNEYRQYWRGYPRRRKLRPAERGTEFNEAPTIAGAGLGCQGL